MKMVIVTNEMGFAREVADRVCFLEGEGVRLSFESPVGTGRWAELRIRPTDVRSFGESHTAGLFLLQFRDISEMVGFVSFTVVF